MIGRKDGPISLIRLFYSLDLRSCLGLLIWFLHARLSVCLCICVSAYLSVCLCVCVSICLSVCLSWPSHCLSPLLFSAIDSIISWSQLLIALFSHDPNAVHGSMRVMTGSVHVTVIRMRVTVLSHMHLFSEASACLWTSSCTLTGQNSFSKFPNRILLELYPSSSPNFTKLLWTRCVGLPLSLTTSIWHWI